MHILVLNQHYGSPDCPNAARTYTLIEELRRRGHAVTLLASRAEYDRRLTDYFPWTPPGTRLRLLDAPYANEMSARGRLLSYANFGRRALLAGLRADPPDVVLAAATPLTTQVVGATLAKLRRAPWVFEMHDLWPDFPAQMMGMPSVAEPPLHGLEAKLYRSAARIVALSTDMADAARERTPPSEHHKILVSEYGSPLTLVDKVMSNGHLEAMRGHLQIAEGRHVIVYAGSFGRANAVPTLLDAARRLHHRDDVAFVFAGMGYYAPQIQEATEEMEHVHLLPPLPLPRTLALFRLASLSLCTFVDLPVLRVNSPSKLYDSLAVGTPVVVTNPGWTKSLMEETGAGWYVPAEDAAALADRIAAVLDDPDELARSRAAAMLTARTRFDRADHVRRVADILEEVALEGRNGSAAPRRVGERKRR